MSSETPLPFALSSLAWPDAIERDFQAIFGSDRSPTRAGDATMPRSTEVANAPSTPHKPASTPKDDEAARQHADEEIDEALDETFPASDPLPVNPGAD